MCTFLHQTLCSIRKVYIASNLHEIIVMNVENIISLNLPALEKCKKLRCFSKVKTFYIDKRPKVPILKTFGFLKSS